MTETMVTVRGVQLCVETFGAPGAPAILLLSGAAASMDWWDTDFCRQLAAGGRFVIRYDHRDTGRSVSYPPGQPGYTARDLVGDAVGLIDTVAGGQAHLAGISMGGGLAQEIALQHAGRVAALTLMSTSPVQGGGDLPPVASRLKAALAQPAPEPDWADHGAVIDYLVEAQRPYAGPDSFDEAYVRDVVSREVHRTVNIESASKNHWLVVGGDDEDGDSAGAGSRLADVAVPTLVIHGSEDPLFPPGHGIALAREIPGAELLLLAGIGHQAPPPSTWSLAVPAMLRLATP
jgi:pimeloyl-ACP methyl ester carboxylesterase